MPALQEPLTQGSPAFVARAQVPQAEVAARGQKVDAHWVSSPQAPATGTVPAAGSHAAPSCPDARAAQSSAGSDCAHATVLAGVAEVPEAPNVSTHPRLALAMHVGSSP